MLPAYDFITALKFAAHAMATNDVRYYLNGVLFRFVGDSLTLTGSDGHRIASVRLKIEGCQLHGDYIVKADSVKTLASGMKPGKKKDGPVVSIEADPVEADSVIVSGLGARFTLAVQDGRYPDFERAIPQEEPKGCPTVGVNPGYLADAGRALKSVANKYRPVIMDTWGANKAVRLRCGPDLTCTSAIEGEAVVHIMPMRL